MALLITFVLVALVFSFLCSIAEAVLLSVTMPYVALLEKRGKPSGPLLRSLKTEISKPLSAILTLNTIAHTIGAAGAGAQVAIVFGNAYLGVASVILTLLILVPLRDHSQDPGRAALASAGAGHGLRPEIPDLDAVPVRAS